MEKGYTVEVNFGVGCCYGSFAIRRGEDEIATTHPMWTSRRSFLAVLSLMAYLEQIPAPERAKLEAQMNRIFDDYERVVPPSVDDAHDFFTKMIIDDIMRAEKRAAKVKN